MKPRHPGRARRSGNASRTRSTTGTRTTRPRENMARQNAVAVENAWLRADLAEQHRETELLSAITRNLSSALDPEAILRTIIEYAKECCGSDMAFIAPYDRARQVATIVASVGTRTDLSLCVDIHPRKRIPGN